jgi:hypothetical protein
MRQPRINYRELQRRYELDGAQATVSHLREALEAKDLAPESFSLRDLFEAVVPDGREAIGLLDPRSQGNTINLLEANSAVDTSAFSNITGQIVYSKVMEAFEMASALGNELCTTIPTRFNGERIPGIGQMGDKAETVDEGQPYPLVGLNEDYIDTPVTVKKGLIVPVTKEAVFFDRTNLVLMRAAEVGEWLGVNKEKRIVDIATGTANNFKWKGTAYNTYQASTPWVNVQASNALVDWTDVEALELLFDGMTDPSSGDHLIVRPDAVLLPSALKHTAERVFLPHNIRFGDGASNTTAYYTNNPIGGQYKILSGPRVKASTNSATTWFFGNFKKAFAYMENWPITVVQAPPNSEDEFNRDIVAKYKASERGVAAVIQPRCVCKSTA